MNKSKHTEFIHRVPHSKSVIVFIHGILGTPNHFNMFLEKVPDDWSVYNILLEGHGGSVDDFAAAGMDKWKNQVHSLIADLSEQYENIYITAHSMGTLFAIDEAIGNPKIRKLFLLNSPLKVGVKFRAVTNSLKLIFDKIKDDDEDALGMAGACSIAVTRPLWKYIKWAPNYLALLSEIVKTRRKVVKIDVPCVVFQSGKDELVALGASKYFAENPLISCEILEDSGHFYYRNSDTKRIAKAFDVFCREENI